MKLSIKDISDFYEQYPEYKGCIEVKTRFGYKKIEEACITKRNEQLFVVDTLNHTIKGSKNHLLFGKDGWIEINCLNPGDFILCENGYEKIIDVYSTEEYLDLYDLQVEEVKEFYANGVVSHNSSIVDSIFWCLFGEMVRGDLKNDEIINNTTKKNCLIKLEFETIFNEEKNDYIIIRGLKPGKLELYKNGESITLSSKSNTTEYISDIINATPQMFMNCIIMSLNNTIPFMAQSKIEKRKFIEQIFNLDFFNKMLLSIRDDFNKTNNEYKVIDAIIQEKQHIIEQNNELYKQYLIKLENKKISLKEKEQQYIKEIENIEKDIEKYNKKDNSKEISECENNIVKYTNEQQKLEETINVFNQEINKNEKIIENEKNELSKIDIKDIEKKYDKLNDAISNITIENSNIEKQINKLSNFKKGDKCPTCKNIIDGDNFENIQQLILSLSNDKNILLKKIEKIKEALIKIDYDNIKIKYDNHKTNIEKLQKENDKKNSELYTINNNILNWEKIINKLKEKIINLKNIDESKNTYINNCNKQKEQIKKFLEDIQNQYNNIKDENPYIEINNNIKKELEKSQQKYDNLKQQLDILNTAKFVVSEEGIKSHILKQVIDIFNNKILYYLNKFESNCIVKFNEMFEVIITNEKGDECSYFNFSGAERKGIDLACLFTFMDMRLLLHGIYYNINIYDELIDTSLDEKGIELVINEIKHRVEKYNEASYIISHRKESLNYATGDIIMLEKEDGITRKVMTNNL